jgi:hypothetical protein
MSFFEKLRAPFLLAGIALESYAEKKPFRVVHRCGGSTWLRCSRAGAGTSRSTFDRKNTHVSEHVFASFFVSSPSYIIYNDLSPSGWALLRCFNQFSSACAPRGGSFAYKLCAPARCFVYVTSLRPRRQLGQRDFQ